jgi:hypothetical protein
MGEKVEFVGGALNFFIETVSLLYYYAQNTAGSKQSLGSAQLQVPKFSSENFFSR